MLQGDEGRIAGHHLTRGRAWRWQNFGGRLMLVTDGGGADVVLSASVVSTKPRLMTCGQDGLMRSIKDRGDPVGNVLASVPSMVDLLRDIVERDDRPRYLPRIIGTLTAIGIEP